MQVHQIFLLTRYLYPWKLDAKDGERDKIRINSTNA